MQSHRSRSYEKLFLSTCRLILLRMKNDIGSTAFPRSDVEYDSLCYASSDDLNLTIKIVILSQRVAMGLWPICYD